MLGHYEGSREKAARKEVGRKAFFISRALRTGLTSIAPPGLVRAGGAVEEALRAGDRGWGGLVRKSGGRATALQNRLGFFRCCRTLGCALCVVR